MVFKNTSGMISFFFFHAVLVTNCSLWGAVDTCSTADSSCGLDGSSAAPPRGGPAEHTPRSVLQDPKLIHPIISLTYLVVRLTRMFMGCGRKPEHPEEIFEPCRPTV